MKRVLKIAVLLGCALTAFALGYLSESESQEVQSPALFGGASTTQQRDGGSSAESGRDETRLWSLVRAPASPWRLIEMEREIALFGVEETFAAIERARRTGYETRRALFYILVQHAHRIAPDRLRELVIPEVKTVFASSASMFSTMPGYLWLTLYPDEALEVGKEMKATSRELLLGLHLGRKMVEQAADGGAIKFPPGASQTEKEWLANHASLAACRLARPQDAVPLLEYVSPAMTSYLAGEIVDALAQDDKDMSAALRTLREVSARFGSAVVDPENVESVFAKFAAKDLGAAMKELVSLPPDQRTAATFGILPELLVKAPAEALASAIENGVLRSAQLSERFSAAVEKNPKGIFEAIVKMEPGADREAAALFLLQSSYEWSPAEMAAMGPILPADIRLGRGLSEAARKGELIDFIRSLPPDSRRAAFEISSTLPDKETAGTDLFTAFPAGADRDWVLLTTAGVADVSSATKFAEQISNPAIRREAYLRISASNPTAAAKNESLMSRLEPPLAEFYKRYPNEGGSSGFAQSLSLVFGAKPDQKKYRAPDFQTRK